MFVEELQKVNFSNYQHFSCVDATYTDFTNTLMKVVNETAPSNGIRIKINTQEWFDREIAELIHACKKSILKNQSYTLTRELSINLKILPGKGKGNSIKLILDKK